MKAESWKIRLWDRKQITKLKFAFWISWLVACSPNEKFAYLSIAQKEKPESGPLDYMTAN